MKARIVAIICCVCLIGFCLTPCSAEGSSGYQQAYIAMLEEYERGNYADAYTAAQYVYEAAPKYESIVNYYNYLTALQVYLPGKQYMDAYNTFAALAFRQFEKSEGYAAYSLGCQYEMNGDYSSALEQFIAAYSNSIDEAYQKIQDCRKKSNEWRYNQAVVLQTQKNYMEAAELFASLTFDFPDAQEKAKECYYSAAEEMSQSGQYNEAADLFTALENYKDSAQKAIQNRTWGKVGGDSNRLGLRMDEVTSSSMTLRWDDPTALGTFTVVYMPAGIETQAITKTQNDTSIQLTELLPNTQYTVSVSSPSNPAFFDKNNFWTSQAAPVSDYNVRGITIDPRLLDRISVRSLGVNKVINTEVNADKQIELSEAGLQRIDRKPSETNFDTYVFLNFFADEFVTPKPADLTFVLRLDEKTSVGKTETILLPEKGFKIVSANLTDLMDVLYENTGFGGSDLTFDVYLNGQHMGSKTILIGKQR